MVLIITTSIFDQTMYKKVFALPFPLPSLFALENCFRFTTKFNVELLNHMIITLG